MMNANEEPQMKGLLSRRLRSENGSAMTEFVITLPIFVMIFAGMGMLHKYSNEALIARMKTNQILVDNSTAPNTVPGFVPGAGGMMSISSFGDIVVNGSGALGMYYDSYIKAGLAETLIPGQAIPNPASPPKRTIAQITGMSGTTAPNSFTNFLMNDLANPTWNGSGWAGILTSIVSTFGVAPSISAGIRYEPILASSSHTFSHPWTGSMTYSPGELQLASPTAAHHRIAAVAASRIAMNTREPYKSCALEFKIGPCMGGNPGASVTVVDNSNEMNALEQEANACLDQNDVWQACLNSCDVSPPSWPANGLFCFNCDCYCEDDMPPSSCQNLAPSLTTYGGAQPNTSYIP
jgi:hypothetical protein